MKTLFHKLPLAAAVAAGLMGIGASAAYAGATIFSTSGSIALGVNDEGHLNTADGGIVVNGGPFVNNNVTGVAYRFPDGNYYDATSPGCYCEGWGVSVNGTNSGFANVSSDAPGSPLNAFGVNNLTVDVAAGGFSNPNPQTATSHVYLTDLPSLKVSQAYTPSITLGNEQILFRDLVTITNTDPLNGVTDLKFVRVMDWDIRPTEFNEYVTIKNTGGSALEESGDNGFASANPLAPYTNITPACYNQDCIDSGPSDHGAYFRFYFNRLAAGASRTFEIFYGATADEPLALAAIARENISLYSLGQSSGVNASGVGNQITGEPATYIFGFKGEGIDVPEPMSLALMGIGMAGLAASRRRRSIA